MIQQKEDELSDLKEELKLKTKKINEIKTRQVELRANITNMTQNLNSMKLKVKTAASDMEGLELQTTG